MAHHGLTGVLLVGGASSRFGSPKALAQYEGTTLADRAWALLGEVADERIAVGKRADRLSLPFPITDDGTDVRAPIAGVVAGLRAASNDLCVVLPVDLPHATPGLLRRLATACADAAVVQTGPLPGAYRRTALPTLERRLTAGELKLRDAVAELRVTTIEADERELVNVNYSTEISRSMPSPLWPGTEQ